MITPTTFLDSALLKVDSESIREWANNPHNRPLWLEMASGAIAKAAPAEPDISLFAGLIVATAIGL